MLTKKEPKKEHIDIGAKLSSIRYMGLDSSMWPSSNIVDQLAADIAKNKKNGIENAFLAPQISKNSACGGLSSKPQDSSSLSYQLSQPKLPRK